MQNDPTRRYRRRPAPQQAVTTIRVPLPLRARLTEAAERNGRTESAEIRSRLELSFLSAG